MTPIYLRSMQALVTAVEQRSFNAAAELLGITPAAVGQRVKALEDYLGVELLIRGRDGIRPADALQAALPDLHRAFGALEAAMDELEFQRQQEIYISTPSDIATLWLKPRLIVFQQANPQILVSVREEGELSDRNGHFDCEISFDQNPDDQLSDLLFRDYILPLGSPLNVERVLKAQPETRLEGFPLLHLDLYQDDSAGLSWPNWIADNDVQRNAPDRGMRFQRVAAVLDAVRADAGLALCGIALARQLIEDGKIGLPYPCSSGLWAEHGVSARYRTDSLKRTHLQRFRNWLRAEGEETSRWVKNFAEH